VQDRAAAGPRHTRSVYLAFDPALERTIAITVLPRSDLFSIGAVFYEL
jgi:hypothetical protein